VSDQIDLWLARLPKDGPSPDLAARINLAVSERIRMKARWGRAAIAAGALGLIGILLMALSWRVSGALPAVPDPSSILEAAGTFLSSPLEAVQGSAGAVLAWESSLVEGIEIAFLVGAVLLTLGSFGGLARLLRPSGSLSGYPQ
jgi:hypothetical protein